jgi:hypothetical protein
MPIRFLSAADKPETTPDIALNPSQRISIHSLDLAVPALFASMKFAMPRTLLVFDPSVFLAILLESFNSVSEHAASITPIFDSFL